MRVKRLYFNGLLGLMSGGGSLFGFVPLGVYFTNSTSPGRQALSNQGSCGPLQVEKWSDANLAERTKGSPVGAGSPKPKLPHQSRNFCFGAGPVGDPTSTVTRRIVPVKMNGVSYDGDTGVRLS